MLSIASVAGGQTAGNDRFFTCSASASRMGPAEPAVANKATDPPHQCASASAGGNTPGGDALSAETVFSDKEDTTKPGLDSVEDSAIARADAAKATASGGPGSVTVEAASSEATASCSGGFAGRSNFGTVTIVQGTSTQEITTRAAAYQFAEGNNAAPNPAFKIYFDEVLVDGKVESANGKPAPADVKQPAPGTAQNQSRTHRAVHIIFTGGQESVIAESTVDSHGPVCIPRDACPAGTQINETGTACVKIEQPVAGECPVGTVREGDVCVRTITVIQPDQPKGGTVVPLGDVAGYNASPCKRGNYGAEVGVVGTERSDRITGTKRDDRVFSFGGRDRIDGGGRNDCLEAGKGNDVADGGEGNDFANGDVGNDILNGGAGRDKMTGKAGNDKLTGGSGNDRLDGGNGRDRVNGGAGNDLLVGGSGNDYINTGNGRDVVKAGSGNDAINAATAGPPSRIDCGKGRDTLRINSNETRRYKSCERVFVTGQIRGKTRRR